MPEREAPTAERLEAKAAPSVEPFVVGTNHRLAPIALRERLAYPPAEVPEALGRLRRALGIEGAVLLSTCNRTEIYGVGVSAAQAADRAALFLAEDRGVPPPALAPALYRFDGGEAVGHLFRVACSLDSMVVGETQVLGQVRDAYALSRTGASLGGNLDRLFHRAFRVAREVSRETRLHAGAVSVPSVAVDLARKIFGELSRARVLVLGSGKTAEEVVRNLLASGVRDFAVANRTPERGALLAAKYRARAVPFESLAKELEWADIVIAGTGSPVPVVTVERLRGALKARSNRPIFLIDLAVPRDVEPAAHDLDNVFLYDIDDLADLAVQNLARREGEVARGLAIVERAVEQFEAERRRTALDPVAADLATALRSLGEAEADRLLARLRAVAAPPDFQEERARRLEEEVRAACRRLVNRILHRPLSALRRGGREGEGERAAEAARLLFDLPGPGGGGE